MTVCRPVSMRAAAICDPMVPPAYGCCSVLIFVGMIKRFAYPNDGDPSNGISEAENLVSGVIGHCCRFRARRRSDYSS